MIEYEAAIAARFLCSVGPPSPALVAYRRYMGGMPLHDGVGLNCEKGATTEIKVQVPGIWAKW